MDKNTLIQYSKEYLPDDRAATAACAWDALASGDPDRAKAIADNFYSYASEAAEQDQRAFDIEALAEDHGALIITAIRTYGNLGPFRPLNRDDFKGVRLFDILLRPGQIACCSTVLPGDSADNIYGSWGVILGRGTIIQAFPYDATSSVSEGEVRSKFLPRIAGMRPSEQIHQALYGRPGLWNEINARVDSVAGMFYCLEEDQPSHQDFPSKAMRAMVEPLGIPQYMLRNGLFYPIDNLEDITSRNPGNASEPKDIVSHSFTPTAAQRDEMISHLTETLTLAPRNAITSGVSRGQFAYDYYNIRPSGNLERFFREQQRLLGEQNPSLRLYGAMALHAFAEAAEEQGDERITARALALARTALQSETYLQYKDRILYSGNLAICESDLRYYLATETLPPYLKDH
ncbi:MAG TPA: hypothetical protein VMR45_00810 [Patescibacteria group bacterium]|nr:hypothetical protein [Patescibacteria group bacterium]